jgi:hypothetical protein
MDIEIIALCDAATESGGKLNILGSFDTIFAPKFPATHPHCAIVLKCRFLRIEQGEHKIRITITNEDGKPVTPPFDAKVNVRFPLGQDSVATNIILNIQSLKFEAAGHYAIDAAVDGRHEKTLPLNVKERIQAKPNLN